MLSERKLEDKLGLPIGIVVAIPTSILSGLSVLLGNNGNFANVGSLDDAIKLIKDASWQNLTYCSISVLSTQILLSYLNSKYLIDSTKTVARLIKKDASYIKAKMTCSDEEVERPSLIENGLFAWCFLTSLIFAEIGSETLAFLGTGAEITGFSLNLAVYFATRFAGARRFFQPWVEQNNNDSTAPTIQKNERSNDKMVTALGYALALASVGPVLLNFVPVSVQGLQKLFHTNLGADEHYQNLASFSIGIFATLPTVFFYCITIKDISKQLQETASLGIDSVRNKQIGDLAWLMAMTLVAFSASYFASIGFKLVGSTNIDDGNLSYLGTTVENTMAYGLLASIVLMFWSHLQHMVNDKFIQRRQPTLPNRNALFQPAESDPLIATVRRDYESTAPGISHSING